MRSPTQILTEPLMRISCMLEGVLAVTKIRDGLRPIAEMAPRFPHLIWLNRT
jgi:hypothetical protein